MVAHTKKHNIDATADHNGVTSATENGLVVYDSNGLPKNPSTDIVVGQKLTSVTTPTADGDAANKGYVDSVAEGLAPKENARARSTENLTLSGEQTIDGVAVVAGDIVLAMDQTNAIQNGLYVVAAGAWARTPKLATGSAAAGAYSWVTEGTLYQDKGYVCIDDKGSDVVGTDELTFNQFSGAGMITAGTGMTKTGDTLNVIGGDGITANADDLAIDLHDTNPGLEIDTAQLRVKTDGAHGIVLGASGVEAELKANYGLSVSADGIAVDLVAAGVGTGGLEFSGGDIQVKTDGSHGIILTATGVEVEIEASKGLEVGASGIAIDPDATTGATVAPITLNANGAGVTVDNSTIGHTAGSLHVNSGGIILQPVIDTLTGASPVRADVSGWSNGDSGVGIGTDGSVWFIHRDEVALVYAVEMSEVGS